MTRKRTAQGVLSELASYKRWGGGLAMTNVTGGCSKRPECTTRERKLAEEIELRAVVHEDQHRKNLLGMDCPTEFS
jgi:hypothetical protein